MKIPYVIDNQKFLLADVLNALLNVHKEMSLDVATAYFTIQGFRLPTTVRDCCENSKSYQPQRGNESLPSQKMNNKQYNK